MMLHNVPTSLPIKKILYYTALCKAYKQRTRSMIMSRPAACGTSSSSSNLVSLSIETSPPNSSVTCAALMAIEINSEL